MTFTKKYIMIAFKLFISLGLIVVLLKFINNKDLFEVIKRINIVVVLFIFVTFGLTQLILAWRWSRILKSCNLEVSLSHSLMLYCIGIFNNNFMPGNLGGDLIRPLYLLQKYPGSKSVLYASVVFERLNGIIATLCLVFFGSTWVALTRNDLRFLTIALLLIVSMAIGISLIKWFSTPHKYVFKLLMNLQDICQRFAADIFMFYKKKHLFAKTIVWSISAQTMYILIYWIIFLSLGQKISIILVLTVIPIAWLIAMVPISLNGYGIREGSMVYLFSYFGVPRDLATVTVLLAIVPVFLFSILGGILSNHKIASPTKTGLKDCKSL